MSHEFRIQTIEELLAGGLSVREACERLQVHRSTLWRLCSRYKKKGAGGLQHGLRGRRSNRSKNEAFRKEVCELYKREYLSAGRSIYAFYQEVGPKLPEYVSYSTVLNWVRSSGGEL